MMYPEDVAPMPGRRAVKVRDLGRDILERSNTCTWIDFIIDEDAKSDHQPPAAAEERRQPQRDQRPQRDQKPPVAPGGRPPPDGEGKGGGQQQQQQKKKKSAARGEQEKAQYELLKSLQAQQQTLIEQQRSLQEQIQRQIESQTHMMESDSLVDLYNSQKKECDGDLLESKSKTSCNTPESSTSPIFQSPRFSCLENNGGDDDDVCSGSIVTTTTTTTSNTTTTAAAAAAAAAASRLDVAGSGRNQPKTRRRIRGELAQMCALRDEGSVGPLLCCLRNDDLLDDKDHRTNPNWTSASSGSRFPQKTSPLHPRPQASEVSTRRGLKSCRAPDGAAMRQLLDQTSSTEHSGGTSGNTGTAFWDKSHNSATSSGDDSDQ